MCVQMRTHVHVFPQKKKYDSICICISISICTHAYIHISVTRSMWIMYISLPPPQHNLAGRHLPSSQATRTWTQTHSVSNHGRTHTGTYLERQSPSTFWQFGRRHLCGRPDICKRKVAQHRPSLTNHNLRSARSRARGRRACCNNGSCSGYLRGNQCRGGRVEAHEYAAWSEPQQRCVSRQYVGARPVLCMHVYV
jgi:hypothetical protein